MEGKQDCCLKEKSRSGLKIGLVYGLLPHSFCLAFLIFSVLGAMTAAAFFRRWLMSPYFFFLLFLLSLAFATVSAIVYLKRSQALSWEGILQKCLYLMTLYFMTVSVNLILFLIVFPLTANLKTFRGKSLVLGESNLTVIALRVGIPCPGHAPLIVEELGKINGVADAKFKFPNLFEVSYDSRKVSLEEIMSLEIFRTFKVEKA